MKTKLILCAAISLALTACGGGGGGGDNPTPPPVAKNALQGKAIDGYIKGATVYLDLNFNSVMDAGEPSATTTEAGDYRLELTQAQEQCAEYVPLVVDVPVGAVDLDTGVVEQAYQMVLPPKFQQITDEDLYHVTPLTTVLWSYVEKQLANDGTLTCQSVMANQQTREKIAFELKASTDRMVKHYNISEQKLYDDYIASGDTQTATLAQEIVRGLQASFGETDELKKKYPDAEYAYVEYHIGDRRDHDNAYPDAWYREQGVYWSNKTITELTKVSDDFTQDIRTLSYQEVVISRGNGYSYRNSYGFESTGGDDSPYTCDDKEIISVSANGKTYELVNLVNFSANEFADCVIDNLADAVTHRYTSVEYKDTDVKYISEFDYTRVAGGFPFLSEWVGVQDTHTTLNMADLVTAFEQLPYQFDDSTIEPNAASWKKSKTTVDAAGISTAISYNDQGIYRKLTQQADGTYSEECGTDGVVWGTCN